MTFLAGWNAIFVGEMSGMSGSLAKVALPVLLYNQARHFEFASGNRQFRESFQGNICLAKAQC
jgi:hypothetical protein